MGGDPPEDDGPRGVGGRDTWSETWGYHVSDHLGTCSFQRSRVNLHYFISGVGVTLGLETVYGSI